MHAMGFTTIEDFYTLSMSCERTELINDKKQGMFRHPDITPNYNFCLIPPEHPAYKYSTFDDDTGIITWLNMPNDPNPIISPQLLETNATVTE